MDFVLSEEFALEVNMTDLARHLAPADNRGLWPALILLCAAPVCAAIGVLGLNPLARYVVADLLWSALTMWLFTGLFITAHDAMHGLILPNHPRLNAWIGRSALFLYAGLSYNRLLKGHIKHHATPSDDPDPDYWPKAPLGPVGWYFRFMWEYLTPIPIVIVASTYHTLAHGVGLEIPRLFAMWIFPQILSSVQLFYFGTYLPHRPDRHFEGEGVLKARSNDFPAWLSLLTCYHFGYHYEHHAAPWVPWWRLHKARGLRLQTKDSA